MSSLCSICGLIFQEKWQLCDHNQKVHETRILKSNIGDDFEAIGQGKLDAHKKKHREKVCKTCWKRIPVNSFTRHKATCSGEKIACEFCIYETPRIDFMKKHHKSMHEVKAPKNLIENLLHTCPHCKKSFKMKKHLTQHLKTHVSTKDFPCPLQCGKEFADKC